MSDEPAVWVREPEPGWTELENQDQIIGESFVSGKGAAMSVRYFSTEDKTVWSKIIFGPGTQGPPGMAHGGSIAAVLDEIMAFAVWHTGCAAMSTGLNVRYRKMVAIPQRCIADARIERVEGRKVFASARLRDLGGGTVFADADAMFLEFVDRTQLNPARSG